MVRNARGTGTVRQVTVAALLLSGAALAEGTSPDAPAEDRQRLEQVRQDPERYARLRREAAAFLRLSPEQQERLRRLDRDLRGQAPAEAARLRRALQRYADWRDGLPEAERRLIDQAPDASTRLRLVKDLRERQWVSRLPKAYRDRIEHAQGSERAALIQRYRQEERRQNREWQVALRNWDELQKGPPPARLQDFPPAVQAFVTEHLRPRLSREEDERLRSAEGQWPLYPRSIVELADKHPLTLPGPGTGPSHFDELPAELQKRLEQWRPGVRLALQQFEGKWPEYAIKATQAARFNKIPLPQQLGPARPEEFSPSLERFVRTQLEPALDPDETARLKRAEKQWPRYPRCVLDLARKHHLPVPGMGLPGPREFWDRFRAQ
jgi:hypothetical protein